LPARSAGAGSTTAASVDDLQAALSGSDPGARAASDAAADLMAEEAQGGFMPNPVEPAAAPATAAADAEPLISREDAAQRLGPKVLAALEAKFNGSLTDIRYPDENDMLL
jgi:hypothetical protein